MPELPDLRILAEAFTAALAGRTLTDIRVKQPLVLRGTTSDLHSLETQLLEHVEQRGKFLLLHFGRGRIVLNAMLTGRLGLAPPGKKPLPQTAITFTFGARPHGRRHPSLAAWTKRAAWVPADDETVELRYRDPKKMGKIYLLPGGFVTTWCRSCQL